MNSTILQSWLSSLNNQQQLLCLLALRQCDTISCDDPMRIISNDYSKVILKEFDKSSIQDIDDDKNFRKISSQVCDSWYHYPISFYKSFMLGCMVIGYKHPDVKIKRKWFNLYVKMAETLSLTILSEEDLDNRFGE